MTTSPNVSAIPTWVTAPPLTSLTTMAPVPANTRANVPMNSAMNGLNFESIRSSVCIMRLAFAYVKTYMWIVRDLTLFHAALSDQTRLRLLSLMRGREICVCYLQAVLKTNQPKISRHLAYLKRAGLVEG